MRPHSFTVTGKGSLYFTTQAVASCAMMVSLESADGTTSEAAAIGRAVRVPQIESVQFTGAGTDLETIEKTGWTASNGVACGSLPSPINSGKQTLRIAMPWPSPAPKSVVYVWLRGEADGRATPISY